MKNFTFEAKLAKIRALVEPLPQEMFLLGDTTEASPDQMDKLELLFTTIYRIRDILDCKEDSDPDVNSVLVKLPELILQKDLDEWMVLFLERASAFSSSFVGALDGFLQGCDIFSTLFAGTKLGPTCIRLVKRSEALDKLQLVLESKSEKDQLDSMDTSVSIENKMDLESDVGLDLNQAKSARSVGSNSSEKVISSKNSDSDHDNGTILTQESPGIATEFTVVQQNHRHVAQRGGSKFLPTNSNNSAKPSTNRFDAFNDGDEEDDHYNTLESTLLTTPNHRTNVDDSLDDDLSLSQAGGSVNFASATTSVSLPDTRSLLAKFSRMEKKIANLTAARDFTAIDAIASYKSSIKSEFDAYIAKATEAAAIKFALQIREKEAIAAQFLAGLNRAETSTLELRKLTAKASESVKALQHYDDRIEKGREFFDDLSAKVEDMDGRLKGYDADLSAKIGILDEKLKGWYEEKLRGYKDEFASLDEKLLSVSKQIAGVSNNSHLDHLQSQLKAPTPSAPPIPSHQSGPIENWGPEVLRKTMAQPVENFSDDASIQVEDVTVASVDNSTIKNKKRTEFLKTSGGKVLIPADFDDLIRVKSPREDMSDKVYVYKVKENFIATWHNSDTQTSIYPLHTWIQFDFKGQLVWAFIDEYEFTSQAPIYCVTVNDTNHEVHAADVLRHSLIKPQFAHVTSTPSRPKHAAVTPVRPSSSMLPAACGDRVPTPGSTARNMRQTTLEDCRPFYVDTSNLQQDTRYPPTPVHSFMNTGPPQIKSNEYIHPFDPLNPRVSSVTSIKNLSTSSIQARLVPLSGIGANSNCREFYTHIKNLMEDLNVPLKSFDDFVKFDDMTDLLDCTEATTHGFSNLQMHAAKLLYQIFEAEKAFLLPDDAFSCSSFATYLDSRDGLTFFSKLLQRHHPILSEQGIKEIPFGPTFDKNKMTIHEYATELIKFQRLSPGYTDADIVVHFLRTIDERFKDAKGSLLAVICRLCKNSRDTVLPPEYRLSQIASTVIERCTTDRTQQNILSSLPTVTNNTTTAFSAEVDSHQINAFDRRPSNTSQQPYDNRSSNSSQQPFSPSHSSTQTSSTSSSTKKKICPCCQSFCRDRCLNLGKLLALQDYQKRFPNLDWTALLKDYKENQKAFQDKINRTYAKRKQVRINRMELEQQLQDDAWPKDFAQSRVHDFVQQEISEDPELLYCSADVNLIDDDEPLITM